MELLMWRLECANAEATDRALAAAGGRLTFALAVGMLFGTELYTIPLGCVPSGKVDSTGRQED